MQLKPGETLIISCMTCDREFELTHEPKAKDMSEREKLGIDPSLLQLLSLVW